MKTFVLLEHGQVADKVNAADSDTLLRQLPSWAGHWIDVTNDVPQPNIRDRFTFNSASQRPVWIGASVTAQPLRELQEAADARANRECGECRAQFLTLIPGQEVTYGLKAAEANALALDMKSNPTPDVNKYPYINQEALHSDRPFLDVAVETIRAASLWQQLGPVVEGLRRGAISRAYAATTVAELQAIFPIHWPKPSDFA